MQFKLVLQKQNNINIFLSFWVLSIFHLIPYFKVVSSLHIFHIAPLIIFHLCIYEVCLLFLLSKNSMSFIYLPSNCHKISHSVFNFQEPVFHSPSSIFLLIKLCTDTDFLYKKNYNFVIYLHNYICQSSFPF